MVTSSTARERSALATPGGTALVAEVTWIRPSTAGRWPRIALAVAVAALLLLVTHLLAQPVLAAPSESLQPAPQASPASQAAPDSGDPVDEEVEGSEDVPGSGTEEPAAQEEGRPDGGTRITPSSRGGARPAAPTQPVGERIVAIATELLGSPYRWSGASPSGFDCSGLTWYVFKKAGFPIPRDLRGQLNAGAGVERDDLQPGDLLIFENTYKQGLSHSGIYIGDNQFIDSQDEWTGVVVNSLESPNWGAHFAGASRPWER